MKCPHCQQDHTDNAKFCPVTGLEIRQEIYILGKDEVTTYACPNCGKQIIFSEKFCSNCGFQLRINQKEANITTKIEEASPITQTRQNLKSKPHIIKNVSVVIFGFVLLIVGFLLINNLLPNPIITFLNSPTPPTLLVKDIATQKNMESVISTETLSLSPQFTPTFETTRENQIVKKYTPPSPEIIAQTKLDVESFDCKTVVDVPYEECQVLVDLYKSTNGAEWENSEGWLQST